MKNEDLLYPFEMVEHNWQREFQVDERIHVRFQQDWKWCYSVFSSFLRAANYKKKNDQTGINVSEKKIEQKKLIKNEFDEISLDNSKRNERIFL